MSTLTMNSERSNNISISRRMTQGKVVLPMTEGRQRQLDRYQDINDDYMKMKAEDPFSCNSTCIRQLADKYNVCYATVLKALKYGGLFRRA